MNERLDIEGGSLPAKENARVARYRRLQSWFREVELDAPAGNYGKYRPLGSYLDAGAVAQNSGLNFLHPEALAHAQQRSVEVAKEGGTLSKPRLFQNMLSSMPMCFNLFGAMRAEPSFLKVFQKLFDAEATDITKIVCEWAPSEPDLGLGDRSAFDALIRYEANGERRFFGIETKYTESFSRKPYDIPRYHEVTRESGWFSDDTDVPERLKKPATNQLWRTVMLAAAADGSTEYGRGSVAVVALSDDPAAEPTVQAIQADLSAAHRDRLSFVPVESILDVADSIGELRDWSRKFRRRYVDFQLADAWAGSTKA